MQEKRLEKKILITNRLGLHARAAAKFVSLTSKCKSKFIVKKGKNTVNGTSLLGLMTLAASKGTEIRVQCIGENANNDLSKLIDLIKNNFGEEKPLSENIKKEKIIKGIGVSSGFAIGNCILTCLSKKQALERINKGLDTIFPGLIDYSHYWYQIDEEYSPTDVSLKPRDSREPLYKALYGLGCLFFIMQLHHNE